MPNNLETAQAMYAAFGRGDIPAILARLADNVSWDATPYDTALRQGLTIVTPRHSPAAVAEFFKIIGTWKFNVFEQMAIAASGDTVMAHFHVDVTFPNGANYRDDEIHLWTFGADGKVKSFRHFFDTAAFAEVQKGVPVSNAA